MLDTVVTVAAPILAIVAVFILAPSGYLTARRGGEPGAIPSRTLAGAAMLFIALVPVVTGGATTLPATFLYLMFWLGASMVLSALPCWLARIFRPTGTFFEHLDHEIAVRYDPSSDRTGENRNMERGDRR